MVLLTERIFHHSPKHPSKLDNHHHHHLHHESEEAVSASLQAFQSDVSNCLNRLAFSLKPGSEFLSLSWIHQCVELLSNIHKAFAKLATEIDYPMTKWEIPSVEAYLNYTLKLLDLLNSISSSLSHLGKTRVSISHALSLLDTSPASAVERLGGIQFKSQSRDLKLLEEKIEDHEEIRNCCGKELVFHQAFVEMKRIGFWVCGIVLFGLSGDIEPYLELKKKAVNGFRVSSSLMALDSSFHQVVAEENGVPKEFREVNEAAAGLVAGVSSGESGGATTKRVERKLEVTEEMLDGIGKEADGVFSAVLAWRNELLDGLRQRKQ